MQTRHSDLADLPENWSRNCSDQRRGRDTQPNERENVGAGLVLGPIGSPPTWKELLKALTWPVLELASEMRIDTVTGYLRTLDQMLSQPRFAGSAPAAALRQQISDFISAPAAC